MQIVDWFFLLSNIHTCSTNECLNDWINSASANIWLHCIDNMVHNCGPNFIRNPLMHSASSSSSSVLYPSPLSQQPHSSSTSLTLCFCHNIVEMVHTMSCSVHICLPSEGSWDSAKWWLITHWLLPILYTLLLINESLALPEKKCLF